MSKVILFTLLVGFAAAIPSRPVLKPIFPENAPRSTKTSRIIDGWPASAGQFPHQVRLLSRISSSKTSLCGASIISETFVLTAAHCVRGFDTFDLGFGSINVNAPIFSITSQKKIEHSGYNPTNLNNDIALVELPAALQWSKLVSPVQLPSYTQASQSFLNRQATVSGFGLTSDSSGASDRLMYVNVRVIGNSECSAYYGTEIVKGFTLCSRGWDHNRQQTCQGDSGGPLVTFDETIGDNIIIGVVSFVSSNGCEAGDPAGYVRVSSYLDWIHKNTGIQIRP
ncbi:serine protease 3-like [Culicoides brevitarsis]|uniref:serine protease 3-like n=1 Tax=Culicoides brevitarsis TaxID=469753 RepID=UPI00307CA0E9